MDSMNANEAAGNGWEGTRRKLEDLFVLIEEAARGARSVHQVEELVWESLLFLGWLLVEQFIALSGDGDEGEWLPGQDGRRLRRLPTRHRRPYRSMFGEHCLERVVYGTREGQRIEAVPLDERLRLPAGKYSYALQQVSQELATQMPFEAVSKTLEGLLGQRIPVDSLEQGNRQLADSVEAFWNELSPPPPKEEGPILVVSADHKGVPMRREAGEASAQPVLAVKQPSEVGLRPGTKKMAHLGVVYSIEPFVRTPEDIVAALFRDPSAEEEASAKRPRPAHKRVRGCLLRDEDGTTATQTETLFGWLGAEVAARNPQGKKPTCVLMDGGRDLWDNGAAVHLPAGTIPILDLIHPLGYLWDAAGVFFNSTGDSARQFVRERVLRILQGEVLSVVQGLRIMAGRHALSDHKRERLRSICAYFENNAARMDYARYLAAGYPICSGVIEGACRHVVVDRMECSGMRWVMSGAQAMLGLRTVQISGLWGDFMAAHIAAEGQRLYPGAAANDSSFMDKAA